ncbi:MAG: hypothetical protein NTX97_05200, partial [Bacteroidetes bacterium]|nr:hypothetical protein [Bacteroidota bacterium]
FAQAKKKGPIDGRVYTIKLIEEGKKKAEPVNDEIGFLPAGKFKSSFMLQAQFTQADFENEVDSTSGSAVYKITVEAKNEDQGRFSWEGTIEGDNISGTATIRKKGKIIHTYTFTGTQKNKKKVKPAPKAVVAPVTPLVDSTKKE